jgi:1-acyl-sn-glycerol-3-phosphate acyltransferase
MLYSILWKKESLSNLLEKIMQINILKKSISLLKWIIIALLTLLCGTLTIAISLVSPKFACLTSVKLWGKLILFFCNIRLKVEGIDNLSDKPLIVMYNHKSFFDIFCFSSFMPYDWRAMMKKELLNFPVFGQAVKIMGHYFVARDGSFEDRREVVRMLKKIKNGRIVFIAPEGTRNPDPGLLDFKTGGFFIARKTDTNILPMIIDGAGSILDKGSMNINSGLITIKFLKEIQVSDYSSNKEGIEKLRLDTSKIFQENI